VPGQLGLRVDYDGRQFSPVGLPAGDQYGRRADVPVGLYHQDGDLVWAEFAGGGVRAGRLVGRCRPDGVIEATYCLVGAGGETVAGAVVSTPTVLDDGRLRLSERWRRLDGSTGISHIEQIPELTLEQAPEQTPEQTKENPA
jgi:hypothetical protein